MHHIVLKQVSFAFPHVNDSPNYLAIEDPPDVGPMEVELNPYTRHYRWSLAFFWHPLPIVYPHGFTTLRSKMGFPRSISMTH